MKYRNLRNMVLVISMVLLSGCDFMNCSESDLYTQNDLQQSFTRTKQMVTNIYGYLPSGFGDIDGAMLDAATDDAVHVYATSLIQRFVNGTWSPNYTVNDVFDKYYRGIHDANLYLEEFKNLSFEEWKHNESYDKWMKDYENYQYEVRFLRAFFYFELVKRYQNIPLVTEVLSAQNANTAMPVSAEKVMDFIIDECEQLSTLLPINYNKFVDKETGRITKGMALALKSRTTLYKASPLFSEDNQEKWKAAATAAYQLIKQADELGYKLDTYPKLFGPTNNTSPEVIMARPSGPGNSFEAANFPMGVEKGRTSTCPTENLVSAYEMTNGSAFDWNNLTPAMRANPYANRDPRLKMTIAHNGMNWPHSNPVEIWKGGANGLPLTNATITGYYLKKYVNTNVNFAAGGTVVTPQHNWVLFRYAEILLNYAEAMTHAYGPLYTDADFPLSAWQAVNQVRNRTNVKMPAFPRELSKLEFIRKLQNERRVELAFEGHRFWDLRRWKNLEESKDIYGMKVVKTSSATEYTRFLLATREITEKLYFYPIDNTEIFKNNNLIQNPEW